ncbi:MAG TPA: T9SS type A sorting domain-containing protein [Bacteroidia bacterium]|nr:T9SS type A sorting domain-containing protein [Bacteroidia bacterium]
MKIFRLCLILLICFFVTPGLHAQDLKRIQSLLNQASDPALVLDAQSLQNTPLKNDDRGKLSSYLAHRKDYEHIIPSFRSSGYPQNNGDTIWVGIAPYPDSLVITGNQTYAWPIIVVNNALLRLKNAHVTIHGDLIAFGHGKIYADHSTLIFPQQYFYQRNIILVQNSIFKAANDTLDYGGFVHNMTITDSASVIFSKVYQTDFMTTGVSRFASVSMNGVNITGEYIIEDHARLSFKNCTQLLLWHQLPDTAVVNWSFPAGNAVYNYKFKRGLTGIAGVNYDISADSCHQVMWGLMPTDGSRITISNSVIRAIGLWFVKNTSVSVTGLADRSFYPNFTAPISDRTLQLNNDSVITWSLYPMNKSKISVSNSTVGEIGAFGSASVSGTFYSVDGSGGYHFSSDTSSTLGNALFATCNVRSERSGLFVMVNSTMYSGAVTAIGNSVMIVLQSTLTQDPVPLEGSAAWNGNIAQLSNTYVDSLIQISGSAWIDKTPSSHLMDFKSYQLLYQKQGASGWTPLGPVVTSRQRNSLLGNWNTHGLSPGNYTLNLKLKDSWGDSASAIKNMTLLPWVMAVHDPENPLSGLQLFPNPASDVAEIFAELSKSAPFEVSLFDVSAREVFSKSSEGISGRQSIYLDLTGIPDGLYVCRIRCGADQTFRKLIISH